MNLGIRLGTSRSARLLGNGAFVWGGGFSHVTDGNHANGLPDTKTNARSNTTVEAADAILAVNVAESVSDRHLLGAVGVLLLALHLDADNLDGLVPGAETTADRGSKDLLHGRELLVAALASGGANPALGETRETKAGAPVGHLADSNSVNTLVNTADTLTAVNVHEGGKGRLGLDTRSCHLVLGDLDSLHAGAKSHGSIGLSDTTGNTADDASAELASTSVARVELSLGSDEEQDGALGRSFNPGPGDETLVD